ncbi:TAXI family TRAP transporter solute-binding subunit [Pseudonocardia asaccharolytica]|uniref:C4-dicarboxylate ABC transporter substrate-binding protein n=1 Tax=Pseudonocardia asaccharolytica DSM 44247 = NBRC 16224 TaxID=1123024 RepID=A0A511D7T7_9PSEU|nr:TAXI family TRAP transporter solute-binding subunit [Pseudonocardia asaccharolytica]GEL18998.1 C4-dicarboxylate ABC transporter substrate-binding protein [Pseudonocardia asaccharolytica DSM 44247 = NBRC 16224]
MAPDTLSRRDVLRVLCVCGVAAGLAPLLSGCSSPFRDERIAIATGGTQGVYYALGGALATIWQEHLRLAVRPEVLSTAGSVQNLALLSSGDADVAFSQVDTAADLLAGTAAGLPRAPRALARIYDDVVHVVVRADSRFHRLADLRGARVSIGAENSGVEPIARRLLTVAGLSPERDVRSTQLGINNSVAAMRADTIDAFFWSGGLPTRGVSELAAAVPIRLLDLGDVRGPVRAAYPVYSTGTVPASSYGLPDPVNTLLVRNFLLVPASMGEDLAEALTSALFAEQPRLSTASPAALTIDARAAIGTQPVPLHPGAEQFYRSTKAF